MSAAHHSNSALGISGDCTAQQRAAWSTQLRASVAEPAGWTRRAQRETHRMSLSSALASASRTSGGGA